MHGCYYGNIFGWSAWWVEMLVSALAVIFIACLIFRLPGRKRSNPDRRDSLNILKCRLASGEITLEEFEKLKEAL
ncbi:MAG: hypothetical protein LBC94_00795 [Desulfovibrio sp.]|jgi:putative membrane protein|nr:hypothetical protein [Desulfovibrio sp.]